MGLAKKLQKFAKKNKIGDTMKDSKFGVVKEFVPTASMTMNLLMSAGVNKGVPMGKSVMIAGQTSSGKTLIAMSAIKNAQKQGYTVIYWDSEFAGVSKSFEAFGIDNEEVIHIPLANITEIKKSFVQICAEIEEDENVLHVFDSMGAWITDKTEADAESGNTARDQTIPGSKKSLMTIINEMTGRKGMGAIIINHVYANIGGYGDNTVIPGGGALYMPSIIIEMTSKAKWKDSRIKDVKKNIVGSIFTMTTKKGRMSKEYIKGQYAIHHRYGISPYYGLLEMAEQGGYIVECKKGRSKAWQRGYELDTLGEEAPKFVDNDIEEIYFKDEFFTGLLQNSDLGDYLNKQFAYGDEDIISDESNESSDIILLQEDSEDSE